MTILYAVIQRHDPDDVSVHPALLSSFFTLTTDRADAERRAANIQGVVAQVGHIVTPLPAEQCAAHDAEMGYQCERPSGHDGDHGAIMEWQWEGEQ